MNYFANIKFCKFILCLQKQYVAVKNIVNSKKRLPPNVKGIAIGQKN